MSEPIYRTEIRVVVLNQGAPWPAMNAQWTLADVEYAIGEGDCLGSYWIESSAELVPADVEAAEQAVGNYDRFFGDEADEEEGEEATDDPA